MAPGQHDSASVTSVTPEPWQVSVGSGSILGNGTCVEGESATLLSVLLGSFELALNSQALLMFLYVLIYMLALTLSLGISNSIFHSFCMIAGELEAWRGRGDWCKVPSQVRARRYMAAFVHPPA